ncbi:hypothetical protein JSE7799_02879 [Jannaschia seosinensis]|uniref:Uncharacterized protein n=1 Tax=Jannaschia seosinensis TaxID=313367 RepID=A0A0M7BD95_9RHOB|nr:hypothetical protein [Jannaschia seosinensis]CUH40149.1 hypothetical protein JSE7799_02879 [Jannaschia seosinensis]
MRILKLGGAEIFTKRFFPIEDIVLRAGFEPDGSLIRYYSDEIHGDNLTGGVLTYHNFGWRLIDDMSAAGYIDAGIEICLEPRLGLYSSNCPVWTDAETGQPGNMLPIVITGRKPS